MVAASKKEVLALITIFGQLGESLEAQKKEINLFYYG